MSILDESTLPVLIVAVLAACNCALVGTYLVLRRMSLLGDAISHGVLPGLVVGFIFAGSLDLVPMLIGALIAALATALLTDLLRRHLRIDGDAAMGVVFTSLFAIGVILIRLYAEQVDLDPGCVLYGSVEYAALDQAGFAIGGWVPPRAAISLGAVLLLDISLVALFFKELLLTSFDPDLGNAVGIRATPMHLLMMGMTAMTTVASFEAVGSILVVAMLVVPATIGHLLADRLLAVLLLAQIAAVLAAVFGLIGADRLDTSVAGMMAVAGGGLFGLTFLFAPRHGLVIRRLRRLGLSLRIAEEDLLGEMYRRWEQASGAIAGEDVDLEPVESPWHPPWIMALARTRLRLAGAIDRLGTTADLTRLGREAARGLVRRHRLWELYLRERLALPSSHLHDPAHRMEHFLDEDLVRRLDERLERPERDPHGREIPAEGEGGEERR